MNYLDKGCSRICPRVGVKGFFSNTPLLSKNYTKTAPLPPDKYYVVFCARGCRISSFYPHPPDVTKLFYPLSSDKKKNAFQPHPRTNSGIFTFLMKSLFRAVPEFVLADGERHLGVSLYKTLLKACNI